jgi:hypothetical protein
MGWALLSVAGGRYNTISRGFQAESIWRYTLTVASPERERRSAMKHRVLAAAASLFLFTGFAVPAFAEVGEVSLAGQYGLPYLPFMVMEHGKLIEKHAKALRIPTLAVKWITLGGPAAGVDALLSGHLSYAGSGATSLATLRSRPPHCGLDSSISSRLYLSCEDMVIDAEKERRTYA